MNAKYLIGSVIIVAFLAWGASAFFKTTVQYVSIDQARKTSKKVQVMGKIDVASVKFASAESRLEFSIYNNEMKTPEPGSLMPVVYYGTVPGNFDQAQSVVLKGKTGSDGQFVADQILVKCPSKYQGEGVDEYQDIQKDVRPSTT